MGFRASSPPFTNIRSLCLTAVERMHAEYYTIEAVKHLRSTRLNHAVMLNHHAVVHLEFIKLNCFILLFAVNLSILSTTIFSKQLTVFPARNFLMMTLKQ